MQDTYRHESAVLNLTSFRHQQAICNDQTGSISTPVGVFPLDYLGMQSERSWDAVTCFMERIVLGTSTWQELQSTDSKTNKERSPHAPSQLTQKGSSTISPGTAKQRGKQDRKTYKLTLAYMGHHFDGWAWQVDKGHNSACEELRRRLRSVFPSPATHLIVESAGRTDVGVHAYGQTVSFYSWESVAPQKIKQAINRPLPLSTNSSNTALAARPSPTSLTCLHCETVPRQFHATHSCKWRRYIYLLPLSPQDAHIWAQHHTPQHKREKIEDTRTAPSAPAPQFGLPATDSPLPPHAQAAWREIAASVHEAISSLEGREIDYYPFGRSTPKGKSCACKLLHASAQLVYLPDYQKDTSRLLHSALPRSATPGEASDGFFSSPGTEARQRGAQGLQSGDPSQQSGQHAQQRMVAVLCVQLVGERFIRRMVRTLVATAFLGALCGDADCVSVPLHERDRRKSAYPAPAEGLCFSGAGYGGDPAVPLDF